MIASLGVGPLLDNEGDKIGLILGLAFIAIALFALPRSPRLPQHRLPAFSARRRRRHRRHRRQRPGQRRQRTHRATALNLVNLFFGLGGLATPFISANLFKRNWVRLCYTVASLTVAHARHPGVTNMPAPTGAGGFVLAEAGPILGRPLLFLLGAFLFLYVSCEVGVWNWLPRHLIAQGIPESRALNILSLGFALGLLIGRVGVSPILIHVPAITVTLAASIAMAITTFLMLRTNKPGRRRGPGLRRRTLHGARLSHHPRHRRQTPFPRMTGTAIGFVITCGWAGLAVSSRIIGAIAGGDPLRLKKALLRHPRIGRSYGWRQPDHPRKYAVSEFDVILSEAQSVRSRRICLGARRRA